MQLLQGQKNSYELIEEIAKNVGAFGKVYKARIANDSTGNFLALKTIDIYQLEQEYGKGYQLEERTKREYTAGLINHKNIVRNYDWGYTDETHQTYFYVMEFYPDGNLHSRISKKARNKQSFTTQEVNNIAGQILSGLKALHSQGIVHRDLKCENILCDGERMALCDFGLCGFVASRITRGAIGGTRGYMPTQQTENDKKNAPLLESLDIYAFGVIAYFLFSYHFPFGDPQDEHAYYKRQKKDDWDDITKYRPDIPDNWVTVIEKCLKNDIKDRFKSVVEINELLDIIPPETTEKTKIIIKKEGPCRANDDVYLQILYGANKPLTFHLNEIVKNKNSNVILIGRNDIGVVNDINFGDSDMFISRRHATIERYDNEKDGYFIIDGQNDGGRFAASKNGIALNGEMVEHFKRYALNFNDSLVMGETNIRIVGKQEAIDAEKKHDNFADEDDSELKKNLKQITEKPSQNEDTAQEGKKTKVFKFFKFKIEIENKPKKTN